MRMLMVCVVVVLFISGKSANPVDNHENIEASGETDSANNDEDIKTVKKSVTQELLNSENEMPVDVVIEPIKRSKKSSYPNIPCAPCGYSDQYAQPSVTYNAPPVAYAPPPPSYGGYPATLPGYGQPQYRPKYGGRKGNYGKPAPVYQPSYQPPPPSYQPQQPSYQPPPPSYQPPQPSYQPAVSYQSSPAPIYSAPSYGRPSYDSPSYGSQVYSAPVYPGPARSYSYPSRGPKVPCGSNLLFNCHPHVSEVPCSGYSPSYGSPVYGQPEQYPQPSYRSNGEEDTQVQIPANPSNEINHDKPSLLDNIPSKTKTTTSKDNTVSSILSGADGAEKGTPNDSKNESNASQPKDTNTSVNNQQALSIEEAKLKKHDTLVKMAQLAQTLAKDSNMQSTGTNDQGKQQTNNLTPATTQQVNGNQNMQPMQSLPGPPPTSMNVGMNAGMNAASSNQVNTQFFHPNPWA